MIETQRLRLRRWRMTDAQAYRRLCADPAVASFLGTPPTLAQARAIIAAQNATLDATGSCFWAAELRDGGGFAGWCGIKPGPVHTPIAGLPEIGWTIAPVHQGEGLAHEAAAATLAWAWTHTKHAALWAITVPNNVASWGLMERLGMVRERGGEFEHPALAADDPLRHHIAYRIDRSA